jgi:hypothetical protein
LRGGIKRQRAAHIGPHALQPPGGASLGQGFDRGQRGRERVIGRLAFQNKLEGCVHRAMLLDVSSHITHVVRRARPARFIRV